MSILCYHAVDARWTSPLSVTPSAFEQHCGWLARRRRVVPLAQAVELLDRSFRLPRAYAAITFDDAFSSLYDHAAAPIASLGLAATVFVVAETLAPQGHEVDWVDTPPSWKLETLSLDQMLDLQERGFSFESHSWAHHDLTMLTEAECREDLRRSRELLEDLLRRPIRFLAFPRGRHAPHVRRAAAHAGYASSFSLPEKLEAVGRHAVPRVGIHRGNGVGTLAIKSTRSYLRLRLSRAEQLGRRPRRLRDRDR